MKKASVPKRQRRMSRGTTLIYHSDTHIKDGIKKPLSHNGTGAKSRYHPALYLCHSPVTGTPAFLTPMFRKDALQ